MLSFALLLPFLVVSLQPTLSPAYSWQFTALPTQCSNLAISIVGSDGQPPYRVLIIPTGATPLGHDIDPRAVIDQAFDGDSTSISFVINYPANSNFVAVVSDASGFGTGGASVETTVANSGDSSCFDPTKTWSPAFDYGVGPNNQLVQCQSTFVWWDASKSQGTVSFFGVIPGGQSFVLPESSISIDPSLVTRFTWTPDVQGGTTLLIVCGDDRGMGTGGRGKFNVQLSSNTACLDSGSPSSTPGVAAGSLQTTTSTSGTSTSSATGASTSNAGGASANDATNNGGGGPNAGVIVAGTVGGIIGLFIVIALIVLCLSQYRRMSRQNRPKSPSMGQVKGIATAVPEATLAHYRPEPLVFPGMGAHNHGSAYSGQGYVEGMAPGATSVVLSLPGSSASGARMSNTTSQVISSWYGQPQSQGNSYGLPQTSGMASVNSGSGGGGIVHDMSSQKGSEHLAPSSSSQGASSGILQASVKSGQAGVVYATPIQKGSKRLAPSSPTQGTSSRIPQTSGLANVKSRGGGGVYDTSSQKGSSVKSGEGGVVSVTSSISGPAYMRGDPSTFSREEPPPAFSSLYVDQNSPTSDVKYDITNPQ